MDFIFLKSAARQHEKGTNFYSKQVCARQYAFIVNLG